MFPSFSQIFPEVTDELHQPSPAKYEKWHKITWHNITAKHLQENNGFASYANESVLTLNETWALLLLLLAGRDTWLSQWEEDKEKRAQSGESFPFWFPKQSKPQNLKIDSISRNFSFLFSDWNSRLKLRNIITSHYALCIPPQTYSEPLAGANFPQV